MEYINHKETWTLCDRDGKEIDTVTMDGWENEAPVFDYAALIREDDEAGDIDEHETFSAVLSSMLYRRDVEITLDDEPIGQIEYRRECDIPSHNGILTVEHWQRGRM